MFNPRLMPGPPVVAPTMRPVGPGVAPHQMINAPMAPGMGAPGMPARHPMGTNMGEIGQPWQNTFARRPV